MFKKFISQILIICFLCSIFPPVLAQGETAIEEPAMYKLYSEKADLKYILTLPKGYDAGSDKKWPVILFLHGSGERGDVVSNVLIRGIPKVAMSDDSFEFITISPQCPSNMDWNILTESLNTLLDEVLSNYKTDSDRVYLTGLSMGGGGTWEMGMCFPNKFAAMIPICGYGDPYFISNLKQMPVWVFHAAGDTTVPISEDQIMVDALKKIGGNVEFTIYPNSDHDAWTQTYNNPEIYKWLLAHKKNPNPIEVKKISSKVDVVTLDTTNVAYCKATNNSPEGDAFDEVYKFAQVNKLIDKPSTKYFIIEDNDDSEAMVTVDKNIAESGSVKTREYEGGLYAKVTVDGGTENVNNTINYLYKWQLSSNYIISKSHFLTELVPYKGKKDIESINLYLPITPRKNIELQINNPILKSDGVEKNIDANGSAPIIINGRTLLPISSVIESLGGSVEWDENLQTVTVKYNDITIEMIINDRIFKINGKQSICDVAPQIIKDRTYMPIRFIAENLGCKVSWNNDTQGITITTK